IVGEGDTDELGLGAVDEMSEDPASSTQTLPVAALPAVPAPPTGGDAGDEHPVAGGHRGHRGADLLDGAHRLVAQDPSVGDIGEITFQDVEVRPADGGA